MRPRVFETFISLSLLTSCVSEKPLQSQAEELKACSARLAEQNQTGIRQIEPADLEIGADSSTPVISNAQKFIVLVPALGQNGEPLIYPQSYEKAGQPILDYTGKPVGDRGLVFLTVKISPGRPLKATVKESLSSMKSRLNKLKSSIKKFKSSIQTQTI